MSALGAMVGQLVFRPQQRSWRPQEAAIPPAGGAASASTLSFSWSLSSPRIRLRGPRQNGRSGRRKPAHHHRCIAVATTDEQVKLLDTESNSGSKSSSAGKTNGEEVPLLKPAPKPVPPPAPKPMPPPARPQANGGGSSQNFRPQNLEKILESAEKLGNSPAAAPRAPSNRGSPPSNFPSRPPVITRQQSTSQRPAGTSPSPSPLQQQQQQTGFKARWVKGDPIASRGGSNGTATRNAQGTTVRPGAAPAPSTVGRPAETGAAPTTPGPSPTFAGQMPRPPTSGPVLNSPPRPSAPTVEPQMSSKPVLTPRPAPQAPTGPKLVDTFRRMPDADVVAARTKAEQATKKPVAGRVTAPTRPGTTGRPGKVDERKKSEAIDGAKRRLAATAENALADAEEIGVNISGVSVARKGRKYSKARRKAERAEAARAAAPVRVEILEVGKQGMAVGDLAHKLAISNADVIKALFMKGIAVTVNQTLDEESVKIVCNEYDVEVLEAGSVRVEEMAKKETEFLDEEDLESLEYRPPVVTVMGHVDHGKTSLLDYIRKTKVAAGEAGGITQAIGAYKVLVKVDGEDQTCVFLDTPGHQAFSAMRARGARVTDVAIIVVAADDGPRPQTKEAIAHAKAAKVPIVVAINKIDKEGADVNRVKEELSKEGLVPPEWGGEDQMVPVSAATGENIDNLLETVMLVAELQDLKANPNRPATGTVIEACLDKTRGPLVTLLVQNGTLKKGDVVLCGGSYGKVRALFDDTGRSQLEARPSTAVQVIGFSSVPISGDEFEIVDTIDEARERAEQHTERSKEARLASLASEGKVTLASLANAVQAGKDLGVESHQLNIVLRVDAQGTVEAIREALQVLPQDAVQLRFLMQATGDITSSDIDLAIASGAIVIGFNVQMQPTVKDKAENQGVEVRQYKVIYDLIDDMRQAMEGLLKPVEEELPIGAAEVRATFSSGSGRVGGCMVTEGKLVKGCGLHVKRGKRTVYTGTLTSLRRVKELAKEVEAGLECGVGVDGFNEWQEGDLVQAFEKVQKKRTLEDASATVTAALASKNS